MITLRDGYTIDLGELRDHGALTLARFKLPTRVEVVEQMPRNAVVKIAKDSLRRVLGAAPDAAAGLGT